LPHLRLLSCGLKNGDPCQAFSSMQSNFCMNVPFVEASARRAMIDYLVIRVI